MTTESARPAHIAFMAVPAHGHVNPGLALVAELVRRGHRVTYATTEDFAPQISAAGATPVLYRSLLPSAAAQEPWPEDHVEAMSLFFEEAVAVLPQVEAAYEDDRPDLIVDDIGALQVPILAKRWDIPHVQLSPTFVGFEGFDEEFDWRSRPGMSEFIARYDAYLAEQGVALTFMSLMAPERCIVTIPRAFQLRGDTVADSYSFVGPMLAERSFQDGWEAPDERPVLLISMGSVHTDRLDFYRKCVEAFRDLDWHVVLSVGKVVDPADLGEVPSNFEVHQWVPQLRILSRASAFIAHCGMGGTMEALYHGVPLIAVPQAADQFANAARVGELGLGTQLDGATATPQDLRKALLEVVSDDDVHRHLRDMRKEIDDSGGVRRAIEILESELPAANQP